MSNSGHKATLQTTIPATANTTEQIMIIRYPLTVLTIAAMVMASGLAFAGGMPSDEGPEVILDDLGFNGGDSLDEDTITAIIKSQLAQPLPTPYIPAAYVTAVAAVVAVAEAPAAALPEEAKFEPALISPEDVLRRDHR